MIKSDRENTYPESTGVGKADGETGPIPRYLQARLVDAPVMLVMEVTENPSGTERLFACMWFANAVAQECIISREQIAAGLFQFVQYPSDVDRYRLIDGDKSPFPFPKGGAR